MRAPALFAATALWCCSFAARAETPPKLVEARRLIDDLELEAGLKVLDAAEKAEGNDRATVLQILTLQGIAWGTLSKDAKTRDSFRKLLILSPTATLPADLPPRVRTPFFEAKEWASTNGPLTATPAAVLGDGLVRTVQVTVEKDVLRLVRTVRFHLKLDGAEQTVDVPLTAGKAEATVGRGAVSWWAELLSERKGVLVEVGSAAAPRQESAVVAPVALIAPPVVEAPGPVAGGWRRPTGVVLLGAGAVAAGVGVVFGLQSSAARSQVTNATKDGLGRVTGVTQSQAAGLETSARTQATVANVLFGVGGALAAAGVVLVVLGPSSEPVVALSPAPGGVVLAGSF